VIDDMVFAIGGFNGVTTIFNVECYDPQADEWYRKTVCRIKIETEIKQCRNRFETVLYKPEQ